MKTEVVGQTLIATDLQAQADAFLTKITQQHNEFAPYNLILDISSDSSVTAKSVRSFQPLSKIHKKGKRSFVIVASGIDYNDVPQSLAVVPTIQEANDIIEMEEIERDLGF